MDHCFLIKTTDARHYGRHHGRRSRGYLHPGTVLVVGRVLLPLEWFVIVQIIRGELRVHNVGGFGGVDTNHRDIRLFLARWR